MDLKTIAIEWETDSKIDNTDLEKECVETFRLHGKYMSYLFTARRRHIQTKNAYFAARGFRTDWYNRVASQEDLDKYEIDEFYTGDKVTKTEMNNKLDCDIWLMRYRDAYDKTQMIIDILNHIITAINNRNWILKTILDNRKFQWGLNN